MGAPKRGLARLQGTVGRLERRDAKAVEMGEIDSGDKWRWEGGTVSASLPVGGLSVPLELASCDQYCSVPFRHSKGEGMRELALQRRWHHRANANAA